MWLSVKVAEASEGKEITQVALFKSGKKFWELALPERVLLAAATPTFVALCAGDGANHGRLHVFSTAGRRALPCLALSSSPALVACRTHHLLVIGCDAELRLWGHLDSPLSAAGSSGPRCLLSTSVAGLVRPGVTVTAARLKGGKNGVAPVITLSTLETYTFSDALQAWMRVADNDNWGSSFRSSLAAGGAADGSLESLRADTAQPAPSWEALARLTHHQERLSTVSHLEVRLCLRLWCSNSPNSCVRTKWLAASLGVRRATWSTGWSSTGATSGRSAGFILSRMLAWKR
jgi:hypothetical protein